MPIGPFSAKDQIAISTLGLEFAVAVAMGTAAGWWADRRWGITPWGTIAGVCVGFALAMYIVWRAAQRLNSAENKK